MTAAREVTFGDFSGRIGKGFEVRVRGHCLLLVLEAAQPLPGSPRPGGAFRLEFLGPRDPVLAQGIYPFEIAGDRFEIFVMPLERDRGGTRYEAMFY